MAEPAGKDLDRARIERSSRISETTVQVQPRSQLCQLVNQRDKINFLETGIVRGLSFAECDRVTRTIAHTLAAGSRPMPITSGLRFW